MTRTTMLTALLLLALPASASGYEGGPVQDGGTIAGTVTLRGEPKVTATPAKLDELREEDRSFCGDKQPLTPTYYTVGDDSRLADVVVWLAGVKEGRPVEVEDSRIDNKSCRFVPHVQAVQVGATVVVANSDPILHNTHSVYAHDRSTAFNVALPVQGQELKKRIRRPGPMRIGCDAGHTWMRAWIYAFSHPYHAVTGSDGAFEMTDVPPGTYELKVWHEGAGFSTHEVTVPPAGNVDVPITLDVNPKHAK